MTIKQNILLFFSFSFFVLTQNMCMEDNLYSLVKLPIEITSHGILTNLKHKSKVSVALTCTSLYDYYKQNPIFIFTGLKNNDYIKSMVYYANKKCNEKCRLLIAHESNQNKEIKKDIVYFFDTSNLNNDVNKTHDEQFTIDCFSKKYGPDYSFDIDEDPAYIPNLLLNDFSIFYLACQQGFDLKGKTEQYKPILIEMTYANPPLLVSALSKLKPKDIAKFDLADEAGDTPLSIATYMGYLDLVKFLLTKTQNKNVQDISGATLLHSAVIGASDQDTEIVRTLLVNKVDPNILDKKFKKAEDYATTEEMKALFIEYHKKNKK